MHETPTDLGAMQELLDRSYALAGPHLQRVITPQRRLDAAQVAERLTGMRLLALATVTADGRNSLWKTPGNGRQRRLYRVWAIDKLQQNMETLITKLPRP